MIAFIIVCIVLLSITALLDLACLGSDELSGLGLVQLLAKIPVIVALSIILGRL